MYNEGIQYVLLTHIAYRAIQQRVDLWTEMKSNFGSWKMNLFKGKQGSLFIMLQAVRLCLEFRVKVMLQLLVLPVLLIMIVCVITNICITSDAALYCVRSKRKCLSLKQQMERHK